MYLWDMNIIRRSSSAEGLFSNKVAGRWVERTFFEGRGLWLQATA
jgi:hypothetical protein